MTGDDIVFLKADWTPEVSAAMEAATGLNAAYTVEELRTEVERGATALRAVVERDPSGSGQSRVLGFVCVWKEPQGKGHELVLQAGAAIADEAGAFARTQPHLDRLARQLGCQSIRAHVATTGRERLLKRHGYSKAEVVMRRHV